MCNVGRSYLWFSRPRIRHWLVRSDLVSGVRASLDLFAPEDARRACDPPLGDTHHQPYGRSPDGNDICLSCCIGYFFIVSLPNVAGISTNMFNSRLCLVNGISLAHLPTSHSRLSTTAIPSVILYRLTSLCTQGNYCGPLPRWDECIVDVLHRGRQGGAVYLAGLVAIGCPQRTGGPYLIHGRSFASAKFDGQSFCQSRVLNTTQTAWACSSTCMSECKNWWQGRGLWRAQKQRRSGHLFSRR